MNYLGAGDTLTRINYILALGEVVASSCGLERGSIVSGYRTANTTHHNRNETITKNMNSAVLVSPGLGSRPRGWVRLGRPGLSGDRQQHVLLVKWVLVVILWSIYYNTQYIFPFTA